MNTNLSFRQLWPWLLLALLLSLGPYAYAWAITPPGYQFSGILANHNDFSAYLAAIRQGSDGRWLYHLTFSPEQWNPVLMLPLYMLVGHLTAPLGLPPIFWFHAMRLGAAIFTAYCLLVWLRTVLPGQLRVQRTAWLFLIFGGGLGWLLYPLFATVASTRFYFPDLNMPEWNFGLLGINAPHYMLGLGLEVLFFALCVRFVHAGSEDWHWALAGMGVAASLGLIYVYHSAVVTPIWGLYLLWLAGKQGRIPWRKWLWGGVMLLPLLPLLYYYAIYVNQDPLWAAYAQKNPYNALPPPPVVGLLIGLGLLGVLAGVGGWSWRGNGRTPLIPLWVGGNLLLMYVPVVQYTGRFTMGLYVPVATLAAWGLETAVLPRLHTPTWAARLKHLTPMPADTARRVVLLLTIPSGVMASLFAMQIVTLNRDFPYYMPQAEVQAAHWLAAHTDPVQDVVLSYYPLSNYLARVSDTHVFAGQFFYTPDLNGRLAQVATFWHESTPDSWRQQFLTQWGISYIYWGEYERRIATGKIPPPGQVVYDQHGVTIYYWNDQRRPED